MLLKRISEDDFSRICDNVFMSAESVAETKFNIRCKLAETMETMIKEAQEKSGDKYIVSSNDVNFYSLKNSNYKITEKNKFINKTLNCYKLYDVNFNDKHDAMYTYKNIWEYYIKENKNKIKIDCDMLSYFRDDIDTHKVMQILLFINTHIQDKYKIDKQDINYQTVKEKIKAFEVCQWTEHISVKTFKNGKIEITIKD